MGDQLHLHQVRHRNHHHFAAVDPLLLRRNRRIRRATENQVNRILRAVRISVQQHIDARGMAESEAMAGGGFFNPLQILAPDHEIHIPRQRGKFRVGLLDVHQNREPAYQFVRHTLRREDLGNLMQHSNQIEQPFFKQGIDRFPLRSSGAQKLLKGENAHCSFLNIVEHQVPAFVSWGRPSLFVVCQVAAPVDDETRSSAPQRNQRQRNRALRLLIT